ncbi:MAG: hypothetical protein R2909_08190 [Gemmatimonadales bacterium]
MPVPEHELGGVHQHRAVGFGFDLEAPEHGGRERLLHRRALGGIVAAGAEPVVRLSEQHAGADPVEADDPLAAELAAIEPDVVRADPAWQRDDVEQLLAELVELDQSLPEVESQ